MNELAIESRPEPSRAHPRGPRGLGAWSLLFGALVTAAGHGVILILGIMTYDRLPGDSTGLTFLIDLGRGRLGAAAVIWLMGAPVLSLLALALRRALMRSRLLPLLAAVAVLATAGSFKLYLFEVVRSF